MSRACKKPEEEVCSIKLPVAKNPRNNAWIDHINKEAKRLKISYMSAVGDKRVRESYAQKKFKSMTITPSLFSATAKGLGKKQLKKGRGKKGDLDKALEEIEQDSVRQQQDSVRQQQEQEQYFSPVRTTIATPKTNTTKKALKALLADSPYETPIKPQRGSAMKLTPPGSSYIRTSTPTLSSLLTASSGSRGAHQSPANNPSSPYVPPRGKIVKRSKKELTAKEKLGKLKELFPEDF